MNNTKSDFSLKDYSLIAFLLPLVGFIMSAYQLWHRKDKNKAKKLLYWSLGGLVANIIWYLIFH